MPISEIEGVDVGTALVTDVGTALVTDVGTALVADVGTSLDVDVGTALGANIGVTVGTGNIIVDIVMRMRSFSTSLVISPSVDLNIESSPLSYILT